MAFWKRRQPADSGVSSEVLEELDHYGRFEWDPQNTPLIGDTDYRMYQWAQSDQADFLTQMARASSAGGWVAYGAERLVVSVLGGNLDNPAYDEIMANALDALRAMGVPFARLNAWEQEWWSSHRGEW